MCLLSLNGALKALKVVFGNMRQTSSNRGKIGTRQFGALQMRNGFKKGILPKTLFW